MSVYKCPNCGSRATQAGLDKANCFTCGATFPIVVQNTSATDVAKKDIGHPVVGENVDQSALLGDESTRGRGEKEGPMRAILDAKAERIRIRDAGLLSPDDSNTAARQVAGDVNPNVAKRVTASAVPQQPTPETPTRKVKGDD